MESNPPNLDRATADDFGREWQRFDQRGLSSAELQRMFAEYFAIFPWDSLPRDAMGFDAGCGSGRWAALVARRVGWVHCIDASTDALAVAQQSLAGLANVSFHAAPAAGLAACVRTLKRGAPMLLYIYYAFDNRPTWFRLLWRASDGLRRLLSRAPFRLKSVVAELLAACVYWPLARGAKVSEQLGGNIANWPLGAYRWRSYYAMRNDALDRFGTRVERRMTRAQIKALMEEAGLRDIRFRDAAPFWCAVGRKV